MKACYVDSDHDDVEACGRTDPIIVEMVFEVDELPSGRKGLSMEGHAYPGVSSGSYFGYAEPLLIWNRTLKERIDRVIESESRWFRNFYPLRPLKLKVTRPDVRQLTNLITVIRTVQVERETDAIEAATVVG